MVGGAERVAHGMNGGTAGISKGDAGVCTGGQHIADYIRTGFRAESKRMHSKMPPYFYFLFRLHKIQGEKISQFFSTALLYQTPDRKYP